MTRILAGTPKVMRETDAKVFDGFPAMGLTLGTLLVFSLWLPAPVLSVMRQARDIIGGTQ